MPFFYTDARTELYVSAEFTHNPVIKMVAIIRRLELRWCLIAIIGGYQGAFR
jgi:hypothetical protein